MGTSTSSSWNGKDRSYRHWDEDGYERLEEYAGILEPFRERAAAFDNLRLRLEESGGSGRDLAEMNLLLREPFTIRGRNWTLNPSLADQDSLRQMLRRTGRSLHLQIRKLPNGFPVWCLLRAKHDYWDYYHPLIVEEYYTSPGYPLADDRFLQVQLDTHDRFELRLSPFREKARLLLPAPVTERQVDELLLQAGRYVLSSAWHEDQRLARITAGLAGAPALIHSVELLYLILGGDLCGLREAMRDHAGPMQGFFEVAYPQPAIRAFLKLLCHLDGQAIDALPQRAARIYRRLSGDFSLCLQTKTKWGTFEKPVPLFKLLLANFSRTSELEGSLAGRPEIRKMGARLTRQARSALDEILREEQAS